MLRVAALIFIVSIPAGPCLAQSVQEMMNQALKNPAVRDAMRGRIPSPSRVPDPNVMMVQRLLNERGFNAGRPDGIAGAGTRAAVADFQRSIGRPATGELAEEELAILNSRDVPRAPEPTEAVDIAEVQSRLTDLGYKPGPVDGTWGRRSQTALDRFRSDQGVGHSGNPTGEDVALLREVLEPPTAEETPEIAAAGKVPLELFALPIVDRGSGFRVMWAESSRPVAVEIIPLWSSIVTNDVRATEGMPLQVTAPDRPGLYHIALVDPDTREILVRKPLEVR